MCPCHSDSRCGQPIQQPECGAHSAGMVNPRSDGFMRRTLAQLYTRRYGGDMTDLSAFPVTRKWPAQHPDRLQLYSLPTPNGVKVSVMLEETGLAYEPHLVRF